MAPHTDTPDPLPLGFVCVETQAGARSPPRSPKPVRRFFCARTFEKLFIESSEPAVIIQSMADSRTAGCQSCLSLIGSFEGIVRDEFASMCREAKAPVSFCLVLIASGVTMPVDERKPTQQLSDPPAVRRSTARQCVI